MEVEISMLGPKSIVSKHYGGRLPEFESLRKQKRKSVDSEEECMENVRERMTHLELENRFLEERVKMLEAELREERLKCDDCKRQLRACQEHLDKERQSNAEYRASSRMWHDLADSLGAKNRALLDEKKAWRRLGIDPKEGA
ncbi:hypothetical protein R1sor_000642 [Riccia sorocarpa]|uniref:Uncharacterized protein n=1 Tax=Riccia sorocarpa TaxID=122646 RepID=A0ABD3GTP6_9MARC